MSKHVPDAQPTERRHRPLRLLTGLALVASGFLGLGLATGSAHASGTDVYVSTTGSDSNPGTSAQPFRTIAKGSSVATAGTTVHVAPGTYTGNFETNASGTATAHVRYVSDTRWGAKIVGSTAEGDWRNNGSYVDIEGFDIYGTNSIGMYVSGNYNRVLHNHIHGFASGDCLLTYPYTLNHVDVVGNTVNGCGANSLDHGIYVATNYGTIANNISYGNAGFGIHCWHGCNNMTISNNLMFGNGQGGMVVGQGDAGATTGANNFVVSNNIAINNGGYGIEEHGSTGSNNRYLDNTVYGNSQGGIYLQTGSQSGTSTSDVRFVSYKSDGTGDYHLQSGSPAIDTGTMTGAPSTAYDDAPRPQGAAPDRGVYEYGSSTTTPAPSPTSTTTPAPSPTSTPTTAPTATIWPSTSVPALIASDGQKVELGVKFRSDVAGQVTGMRFYKGTGNTGTHVGSLWTSSGTRLASATFTNETSTGWQTVKFATPVSISANTDYVVSYLAPVGHYGLDSYAFQSSGVDRAPLHALAAGTTGNGVYVYGGGFPSKSYRASNYWVDVTFVPSA